MIIMILIRICQHGLKRLNISLIVFHTGHNSVTDIKDQKNMNVQEAIITFNLYIPESFCILVRQRKTTGRTVELLY